MEKRKFWNLFILLAVYVVTISFPLYLIPGIKDDIFVMQSIELALRAAYLVFIILFSIFTKLAKNYNGKTNVKNLLLLLPLFLVAFMNIFYWGVVAHINFNNVFKDFGPEGNHSYEIMLLFTVLITVAEEELLFRYILQKNLTIGHKIFRILVTASIFAACHFFELVFNHHGLFPPLESLQILLVFGIGIILGFLFEYTNNIFVPITFSLIYALCTDLFFPVAFTGVAPSYYITISCFAIGAAAYLVIFYFVMLKKENR